MCDVCVCERESVCECVCVFLSFFVADTLTLSIRGPQEVPGTVSMYSHNLHIFVCGCKCS